MSIMSSVLHYWFFCEHIIKKVLGVFQHDYALYTGVNNFSNRYIRIYLCVCLEMDHTFIRTLTDVCQLCIIQWHCYGDIPSSYNRYSVIYWLLNIHQCLLKDYGFLGPVNVAVTSSWWKSTRNCVLCWPVHEYMFFKYLHLGHYVIIRSGGAILTEAEVHNYATLTQIVYHVAEDLHSLMV